MFILATSYCPDDVPQSLSSTEAFVIYIGDKICARQKVLYIKYGGPNIFQREIFNNAWLTDWTEIPNWSTVATLENKVNNLESKFNNLFTQDGNTLTINY